MASSHGPTPQQSAFLSRATPGELDAFVLSGEVMVAGIDRLTESGHPERCFQAVIHGVPVGPPRTGIEEAYAQGARLQTLARARPGPRVALDIAALGLQAGASRPTLIMAMRIDVDE